MAKYDNDYLASIMPGLSVRQYEARRLILMARDFAATARAQDDLPYHSWELMRLAGDAAQELAYRKMDDERLEQAKDYCRRLIQTAILAQDIFNAK